MKMRYPGSYVNVNVEVSKHVPEDHIYMIQNSARESLSSFIGEKDTPETRARIAAQVKDHFADYVSIDPTAGALTPEILQAAFDKTRNQFGSPDIKIKGFNVENETDIENRQLKTKIKELEEQIEYYKMLSMEN